MQLGAFSLSLTVKDIAASAASTRSLDSPGPGATSTQNWLILQNGETVIGLFQGMFEKNMLTFNPGWNQDAEPLDSFTDVRDLQRQLKAQGMHFVVRGRRGNDGAGELHRGGPGRQPGPCRSARLIRPST